MFLKRGAWVTSINSGKHCVSARACVCVWERLCNGSPMSGMWGPFRFPFPWFCLSPVSQWQIVPVACANLFDRSATRTWAVSVHWINAWANGQKRNNKPKKKFGSRFIKLLSAHFLFFFTCTVLCHIQMRVSVFWLRNHFYPLSMLGIEFINNINI